MKPEKKKKRVILSMILISLFFFVQVAVNRVLCCSSSGSKKIEFAFFGVECDCFEESCQSHSHHPDSHPHQHSNQDSHNATESIKTELCEFCFDIPLANFYISPGTINLRNLEKIIYHQITLDQGSLIMNRFSGISHYNLFPLSKFLLKKTVLLDCVILRC